MEGFYLFLVLIRFVILHGYILRKILCWGGGGVLEKIKMRVEGKSWKEKIVKKVVKCLKIVFFWVINAKFFVYVHCTKRKMDLKGGG